MLQHEHVAGDGFASRESVVFRHALLCRAALESVRHLAPGGAPFGEQNTVFVAHDWHAALLPLMLQACYRIHGKMLGCRAVMVVHDVARQVAPPPKASLQRGRHQNSSSIQCKSNDLEMCRRSRI